MLFQRHRAIGLSIMPSPCRPTHTTHFLAVPSYHTTGHRPRDPPLPAPCPRPPLHPLLPAINVTSHPPPIEVARLWLNLFSINKALPRSSIKAQIAFDSLKPFGRIIVAPCSVFHFFITIKRLEIEVCGAAFPFAEAAVGTASEGNGNGGWGEVVCWGFC